MTKAFHNNVKLSGYSRKVNPVYHVETKKENRWTLQKKNGFNSTSGAEAGKKMASLMSLSNLWKIRSDF